MLAHKLGKDLSLDEGNMLRKVLTKKGTGKAAKVKAALHGISGADDLVVAVGTDGTILRRTAG